MSIRKKNISSFSAILVKFLNNKILLFSAIMIVTAILSIFKYDRQDISDLNTQKLQVSYSKESIEHYNRSLDFEIEPIKKMEVRQYENKRKLITTAPDKTDIFRQSVMSGDQTLINEVLETISGCSECIEKMIEMMSDPVEEDIIKEYVAKVLIKDGSKESVLAVLNAIIQANENHNEQLKGNLMQIFAELNTPQAVESLVDILIQDNHDLRKLPDEIKYAITKAIKLIPDENVGRIIQERLYTAGTEEQSTLLNINHPMVNVNLLAEAYTNGDKKEFNDSLANILLTQDKSIIPEIISLAKEEGIELEKVGSLVGAWLFINQEQLNNTHEIFIDYLSNPNSTPEEKAIAAYSMAYEKDKNTALYVLDKAYNNEEDPFVRSYIENAILTLNGNH